VPEIAQCPINTCCAEVERGAAVTDAVVQRMRRPQSIGVVRRARTVQDLVDRGRKEGWGYLYWHTQAGNATARRLYDTFTLADDFVKYRVSLA